MNSLTLKIEYADRAGNSRILLTGNNPNYASWDVQFQKFLYRNIKWLDSIELLSRDIHGIKSVAKSNHPWPQWGGTAYFGGTPGEVGLQFQKVILNREERQSDEPDNKHPSKWENFKFENSDYYRRKVIKMYLERLRGLPDIYSRLKNKTPDVTVRVELFDEDGVPTRMLVGGKNWVDEYQQHMYRVIQWRSEKEPGARLLYGIGTVEIANENWPGRGLKTCAEKDFQGYLDDSPAGSMKKQYSSYNFLPSLVGQRICYNLYKDRLRGILPDPYSMKRLI